MMIEPTETESKETLDAFAETLFRITEESPDLLHEAPHTTTHQPARRSAGGTPTNPSLGAGEVNVGAFTA